MEFFNLLNNDQDILLADVSTTHGMLDYDVGPYMEWSTSTGDDEDDSDYGSLATEEPFCNISDTEEASTIDDISPSISPNGFVNLDGFDAGHVQSTPGAVAGYCGPISQMNSCSRWSSNTNMETDRASTSPVDTNMETDRASTSAVDSLFSWSSRDNVLSLNADESSSLANSLFSWSPSNVSSQATNESTSSASLRNSSRPWSPSNTGLSPSYSEAASCASSADSLFAFNTMSSASDSNRVGAASDTWSAGSWLSSITETSSTEATLISPDSQPSPVDQSVPMDTNNFSQVWGVSANLNLDSVISQLSGGQQVPVSHRSSPRVIRRRKERRFPLETPLHRQLMNCRLFSNANMSTYVCCPRQCYYHWLYNLTQ